MRFHDDTLPVTTLFLLTSVDGKISTGADDDFDIEKDIKYGPAATGMKSYYDRQSRMSNWTTLSGKILDKIGYNTAEDIKPLRMVSCIVFDNSHLTAYGVENVCKRFYRVLLVTQNNQHPAILLKEQLPTLSVLVQSYLDVKDAFRLAKANLDCSELTIETGGTMNDIFLKDNVIDKVHIIMAPILIGGKNTPTLVDGEGCRTIQEVNKLRQLRLEHFDQLPDSYMELVYTVI